MKSKDKIPESVLNKEFNRIHFFEQQREILNKMYGVSSLPSNFEKQEYESLKNKAYENYIKSKDEKSNFSKTVKIDETPNTSVEEPEKFSQNDDEEEKIDKKIPQNTSKPYITNRTTSNVSTELPRYTHEEVLNMHRHYRDKFYYLSVFPSLIDNIYASTDFTLNNNYSKITPSTAIKHQAIISTYIESLFRRGSMLTHLNELKNFKAGKILELRDIICIIYNIENPRDPKVSLCVFLFDYLVEDIGKYQLIDFEDSHRTVNAMSRVIYTVFSRILSLDSEKNTDILKVESEEEECIINKEELAYDIVNMMLEKENKVFDSEESKIEEIEIRKYDVLDYINKNKKTLEK